MKVLNLRCALQHSFEGWFASEDDYQSQLARGLVECPVCADTTIAKMPTAPRLNLGAASSAAAAPREEAPQGSAPTVPVPVDPQAQQVQAALWKMARHIIANTEDVGPRFAEESRKIHYGESAERGIRGQASRAETEALLEEGIAVMPLPAALKETLQ